MDNNPFVQKRLPADACYHEIVNQLRCFQSILNDDCEVGIIFPNYAPDMVLRITDIGYQNPDLVYFCGEINGSDVHFIQHVSQINFALLALKKPDPSLPARRFSL